MSGFSDECEGCRFWSEGRKGSGWCRVDDERGVYVGEDGRWRCDSFVRRHGVDWQGLVYRNETIHVTRHGGQK